MLDRAKRHRIPLFSAAAAAIGLAAFVACSDDPAGPGVAPPVDGGGDVADADAGVPGEGGVSLTLQEQVQARLQSPLPALPKSPTNRWADDPRAATLGQMFFFDKAMAGPIAAAPNDLGDAGEAGKVSCASCHVAPWGSDTRSKPNKVSLGTSWTDRNTPPIVNAAFYEWFYWDGRVDSLWAQAALAGENAKQQGSDRLRIGRMIFQKYKAEYEAIFGPLDTRFGGTPSSDGGNDAFPLSGKPGVPAYDTLPQGDKDIVTQVLVNWAKCIEAYERLLVSRNSPWDRFVAGDKAAISDSAIRGYKLFVGRAYCNNCHTGPLFSDSRSHNIGVPQPQGDPHVPATDLGRFATLKTAAASAFRGDGRWSDDPDAGAAKIAKAPDFVAATGPDGSVPDSEKGLFRTKHLRQIAETGPYMHHGTLGTLDEVLALYNAGGGDSGIGTLDPAFRGHVPVSPADQADLLAFLQTLTGERPPEALLRDTSKP